MDNEFRPFSWHDLPAPGLPTLADQLVWTPELVLRVQELERKVARLETAQRRWPKRKRNRRHR